MQDVRGNDVRQGDRVVFATKTEAPSLQFGRILAIEEDSKIYENYQGRPPTKDVKVKIKVQKTDPAGKDLNKIKFEKNPVTDKYEYMDTGKKDTAILVEEFYFGNEPWPDHGQSHRLMVL